MRAHRQHLVVRGSRLCLHCLVCLLTHVASSIPAVAVDFHQTAVSASQPPSAHTNCFHVASSSDKPTALTTGLSLAHQTLIVPLTSPPPASTLSSTTGCSNRSSNRSSSCSHQQEAKMDIEQMSVDSGVSCGTDFSKAAKTEQKDRSLVRSTDNLASCVSPSSPTSLQLGGSNPNIAPQHSYHSDLYNTAFALHSLSSVGGWTDYLSQARSLWDGCLRQQLDVGEGAVTGKRDDDDQGTERGASNGAVNPVEVVRVGGVKTEEDFLCGGCTDSPKTTPPSTLNSAPAEGGYHDTELTAIIEPLMVVLPSYSPGPAGEATNPFTEGTSAARSPRTIRHGVKKPAPMPPGVMLTPDKATGATEGGVHSSISSEEALERSPSEKPPLPDRPNAPPPAPPEKPSLTKVDPHCKSANGMSSPRPDRPRGPPPERPPGPLPERSHDRPMVAPPERPQSTSSEQPPGGQRSSKPPPRPMPPPRGSHKDTPKVPLPPGGSTTDEAAPPVLERKESNECSSPVPEETHL
ncbi:hypothetical protein LSAT2_025305 [Lamellibrachia satsuma]|nr:hypothetical protein LSAT2_025305 [Lamellibrachia satsuma]